MCEVANTSEGRLKELQTNLVKATAKAKNLQASLRKLQREDAERAAEEATRGAREAQEREERESALKAAKAKAAADKKAEKAAEKVAFEQKVIARRRSLDATK